MGDLDYYRRYVGDYARDTARLSMIEHGAYNLLLDHYYAEERPLPLDMDEIYRIVRAVIPEERKAIGRILEKFFYREEDGYRHRRVDAEIAKAVQARVNGSRGGRPTGKHEPGSSTGTGSETLPTTNHQPPAANHQPPGKDKAAAKPQLVDFTLPPWIKPETWQAFEDMRRTIRKPLTPRARDLIVGKLLDLGGADHAGVEAILEQSIRNSWQDVYAVKPERGGAPGAASKLEEGNFHRGRDWAKGGRHD